MARSHGVDEVVKVKSIATDEIGLNEGLAAAGVLAVETDLAELIIQLDGDFPSHILVPAIHRNRAEIRAIFRRELGLDDLTDEPAALAEAARLHLRAKFLSARMGVSGANFAVAETGSVCVFESEGNGRMCTTLPEVLVTVMGIEKVIPSWRDMEVFLQLLPRSSTGERLNPYTSVWSGVGPDGPSEFHLVLIDNGRVQTLADEVGRQALRCIRCSACLNVCPVYSRVGGHAYGSVYPGPIGAILTPQLRGIEEAPSLPYASSLCGACGDVCPVKIEIPRLLTHLRAREVAARRRLDPEKLTMRALFHTFSTRERYERAQKVARTAARPLARGRSTISRAPGPLAGWTMSRDLPAPAPETFREWWRRTRGPAGASRGTDVCVDRALRGKRRHRCRPRGAARPPERAAARRLEAAATRGPTSFTASARPFTTPRRVTSRATTAPRTHGNVTRSSTCSPSGSRSTARRCTGWARPRSGRRSRGSRGRRPRSESESPRISLRDGGPAGVELVEDAPLSVPELDALDGALTGCAVAIAEAGAFVLDGGPGQGRRALSLVPDLHICVVREDQVVGLVPEAVAVLEASVTSGRALTFVAGPSATSDIELDRVEGVHGPRTLHVVVVAS